MCEQHYCHTTFTPPLAPLPPPPHHHLVATTPAGPRSLGVNRTLQAREDCKLWGFGRNLNSELLQPAVNGRWLNYPGPVQIAGRALSGLDAGDIRFIQGGNTGASSGLAVTCT
jgi:hypothetical protein